MKKTNIQIPNYEWKMMTTVFSIFKKISKWLGTLYNLELDTSGTRGEENVKEGLAKCLRSSRSLSQCWPTVAVPLFADRDLYYLDRKIQDSNLENTNSNWQRADCNQHRETQLPQGIQGNECRNFRHSSPSWLPKCQHL